MDKVLTPEQVNRRLRNKRIWAKVGKIMANVFIYLMLLIMYAPLVYIAIFSFTKNKVIGVWNWNEFGFINYQSLFNFAKNKDSRELWSAVGNTLLVAGLASTLATVLGTLGAIGIYYTRKKWLRSTFEFINQIPVVNAEIVTAISLSVLFVIAMNLFKIPRSLFTVVLGHMVLAIPYVVLSVEPKLEQMDPSTYEAALDLGANQTQALWKVTIPDVIPGIITGFLLSFTLSLDDYVITAFTKPAVGGFETLSTYVDNKIVKGGVPIQLRAFTTILFVVILLVMLAMTIKAMKDAKSQNKKEEK